MRIDVAVLLLIASASATGRAKEPSHATKLRQAQAAIQHVVIIMQENRSFDSYFGTFPGADGPPAGTCVPLNPADPKKRCIAPFHDPHDLNAGAMHKASDAQADIDDGITTAKMDGFNLSQTTSGYEYCSPRVGTVNCILLATGSLRHDVMGYHDAREIPNYWAYARNYVLQDQLYTSVRSASKPSHLGLLSEWAATCSNKNEALSCVSDSTEKSPLNAKTTLPWVNLFQLLDVNNVSWKSYVDEGIEPDCEGGELACPAVPQSAVAGSPWNPAPFFAWVQAKGPTYLAAHDQPAAQFLADLQANTLPQVSWIVPSAPDSEHPPASVTRGMEYVTALVNAIMASPAGPSTAIFISWDDWGGFYDHVAPPDVDTNATPYPIQGYGLRVPGIMISSYAKQGYIDHSVLSFDSYARFFEDLFAGGARLDPAALGNPDNRPDIRDELNSVTFVGGATAPIGDLLDEFDFTAPALQPLILSTAIPVQLTTNCKASFATLQCTTPNVVLTWKPIGAGATGTPPYTYHAERDGTALQGCVTTKNDCVDANVPSGKHLYRIRSVDSAGVASPKSGAVEADIP